MTTPAAIEDFLRNKDKDDQDAEAIVLTAKKSMSKTSHFRGSSFGISKSVQAMPKPEKTERAVNTDPEELELGIVAGYPF